MLLRSVGDWAVEARGLGAGDGRAWLGFHVEAFRYIVYTATGRGWGEKAGVAVEQNGEPLTNPPFHGAVKSELGPEFFNTPGIPDDSAPFDLP